MILVYGRGKLAKNRDRREASIFSHLNSGSSERDCATPAGIIPPYKFYFGSGIILSSAAHGKRAQNRPTRARQIGDPHTEI